MGSKGRKAHWVFMEKRKKGKPWWKKGEEGGVFKQFRDTKRMPDRAKKKAGGGGKKERSTGKTGKVVRESERGPVGPLQNGTCGGSGERWRQKKKPPSNSQRRREFPEKKGLTKGNQFSPRRRGTKRNWEIKKKVPRGEKAPFEKGKRRWWKNSKTTKNKTGRNEKNSVLERRRGSTKRGR